MKSIFINKNSQTRSGWKITSVFASFFFAVNMITFLIFFLYSNYQVAFKRVPQNELTTLVNNLTNSISDISTTLGLTINVLQCLFLIFFVVLFWKIYDKKPIRDIGMISLKKGYKDLIIGLAFGAISLLIVFFILLATKCITLTTPLNKPNFNISLLTGLILFIFVGINEEMFARGYCMTVLKQTGNKYVVVIVSSLIFSAMHSLNPGMSLFSYINLFLFGLLTAYMTLKSQNLWLAIGYHITWNYFQGNICGFLVSGQTTSSMYSLEIGSNSLINGGQFGPEGGIIVTFIILLNFLYLWKVYKPSYKVY
ncbi:CPBP family intramembrane glutamic endopeptidase [Clostridium thermarum]|uniref:CPBP family intramembrane glutamic endopeptidase n=1 Tax=Clostridium thermarum TaxID=1716543 RepID=UPI001FAA41F1|nr:CPBP family intramembrane glutamic endopeptidase [Clostridium thermarum]